MFFYVSCHENNKRGDTPATQEVLERTEIARGKEKGQTKFRMSGLLLSMTETGSSIRMKLAEWSRVGNDHMARISFLLGVQ